MPKKQSYSEMYTSQYYHEYAGQGYTEETFGALFEWIADKIVEQFHPKTMLDVGCAHGFLLTRLRDRGVEAYGIDVSEYAISHVPEKYAPFCAVASLADGKLPASFPQKYDLVYCVEVLEHLYEEDSQAALEALCSWGDVLYISACPSAEGDPYHVNAQPMKYWLNRFDSLGFDQLKTPQLFKVTSYAFCVCRRDSVPGKLADLFTEPLRQAKEALSQMQGQLDAQSDWIATEASACRAAVERVSASEAGLRRAFQELKTTADTMRHTLSWRLTLPFRLLKRAVKYVARRAPGVRYLYSILACIKDNGVSAVPQQMRNRRFLLRHFKGKSLNVLDFSPFESLRYQVDSVPVNGPYISVIVPLFNTPPRMLREMIDSVLNQTYDRWELCLADGSDVRHPYVEKIAKQYARRHKNIKYRKLAENMGISGNTNAARSMAQGDYYAMLDHDDLLHPSALYEVSKTVMYEHADVIFSDEVLFQNGPKNIVAYILKPDYGSYTILSGNYMCHFLCYSRFLAERLGEYRTDMDGAQDYYYILQLCRLARKIAHVRKILYYWRRHSGSVSMSIDVKPYAVESARKALKDHLVQLGAQGEVQFLKGLIGMYHVRFTVVGTPLISIVIGCMPNGRANAVRCIDSILEKSDYRHFELLLAYGGSREDYALEPNMPRENDGQTRVLFLPEAKNVASLYNLAAEQAFGEHLLFLHPNTHVISGDWLETLLSYSQRADVGAVGAKLFFINDTVYTAGLVLGLNGTAGHVYRGASRSDVGQIGLLLSAHNVSALSWECMMIKRSLFLEANGFSSHYEALADADLCLRLLDQKRSNVVAPYATLYRHADTASAKANSDPSPSLTESERFMQDWAEKMLYGDPWFNPHFRMDTLIPTVDTSHLPPY